MSYEFAAVLGYILGTAEIRCLFHRENELHLSKRQGNWCGINIPLLFPWFESAADQTTSWIILMNKKIP